MAKSKAALGIEVLGDELRLALVEQSDQGVSLLRTQVLSAGDDLGRHLRSLPKRPSSVACSVSLEHAGIRVLNLPPTTEENLERLVTLEAEAALPLASDDLALSHHVLGMTEQSRLEVMVAAARLSSVQSVIARASAGFSSSPEVTVTSAALVNALAQLRGPGREQICAVLRVEERESELMVLDRNRVIVAQFLQQGCGEVSVAAPTPVPVAAGVGAGSGAAVAEADPVVAPVLPWVASVSQQVRYLLQALSYDRGVVVERLYLCGAGALRSGAQWQLSERLDLPVSFLSPSGADAGEGSQFAVAYGCAIQAIGAATLPLNLTPARVAVEREVEQRRQTRLSWGALVASLVVAGSLVFGAMLYNRQQALAEVEKKLADLGPLATQSASAIPGTGDPKKLKEASEGITQALAVRVPPAELIQILGQDVPAAAWLSEITYNSETGIIIRGYATNDVAPQQAMVALLQRQKFDEVTLDYRTQELLNKVPVWSFQISCKLRPKDTRRGTRSAR